MVFINWVDCCVPKEGEKPFPHLRLLALHLPLLHQIFSSQLHSFYHRFQLLSSRSWGMQVMLHTSWLLKRATESLILPENQSVSRTLKNFNNPAQYVPRVLWAGVFPVLVERSLLFVSVALSSLLSSNYRWRHIIMFQVYWDLDGVYSPSIRRVMLQIKYVSFNALCTLRKSLYFLSLYC